MHKKVLIITQRDPFFIDTFLHEIQEKYTNFLILDLPNFNKGKMWAFKRAFQLYGLIGTFKLIFYRIIFFIKRDSLKLKVIRCENVFECEKYISLLDKGDILLSLSAPSKIPLSKIKDDVLAVNIHCGKLPEYAGMMPIFWQIFDKKNCVTITFQILGSDIDSGDILLEKEIELKGTLFETSLVAKKVSAEVFYNEFIDKNFIKKEGGINNDISVLNKFPEKEDIIKLRRNNKLI